MKQPLKGRTLEQKAEARRLYADGVPPTEISTRIGGVPVSTVKTWCKDLPRQTPSRGVHNLKPKPIHVLTPRAALDLAISGAWR
jgi:hypothetical protein